MCCRTLQLQAGGVIASVMVTFTPVNFASRLRQQRVACAVHSAFSRALMTFLAAAIFVFGSLSATAHPHVWITVETTVLVEAGAFTGLRYVWVFDKQYKDQLLAELDTDKDGVLSDDELKAWFELSIKTLRDQKLFTVAKVGKQKINFEGPRDARFEARGDGLALHFTAPVATSGMTPAVLTGGELQIDIYDPTFFSGFTYASDLPIVVEALPQVRCEAVVALNPGGEQQKVINAFMKVFGRIDAKVPPAKTLTVKCPNGQLGQL